MYIIIISKCTKTIPKMTNIKHLTKRERGTYNRFDNAIRYSMLFKEYFKLGFKSFEAVKTLMQCYFPEKDLKNLWFFWHLRIDSEEYYSCLEIILEKLKQE